MNRIIALICTLLWSTQLSAQFFDDFSDGDFNANPSWQGMDSNFIVQNQELKLNAGALTSESFLVTPFNLSDGIEWAFRLKMDFTPSSSNQCYFYLLCDTADPRGNVEGYFVRVGGIDRDISLMRQDNDRSSANLTMLIDGQNSTVNTTSVDVRVRVRRDAQGNWELWRDLNAGEDFLSEGTATDTTYKVNQHVAILCDYTATRSTKFSFDDIYAGAYRLDTISPNITSIDVIDLDSLLLHFSENLVASSANMTSNFSLSSGPAVSFAKLGADSSSIEISLSSALINGQSYQLFSQNQSDLNGNVQAIDSIYFTARIAEIANPQDIIINEFMADPSPPVVLPQAEFIELYNRSSKFISLDNWGISDAASSANLAEHWLDPNDYVILCDPADSADLASYGNVLPVSRFPSLNNGGDMIILKDDQAVVIDQLEYRLDWYKDPAKEAGGFSLEKINPFSPCDGAFNWSGSESIDGGTPGQLNSVYDTARSSEAVKITDVIVQSKRTIRAYFSRSIDTNQTAGSSFNAQAENASSDSLSVIRFGADFVDLQFSDDIDTGFTYTLIANDLYDCYGTKFGASFRFFGIGDEPEALEILITEIYAIPAEAGSGRPTAEFIEIYNNSDRYLRLADLFLSDASSSANIGEGNIRQKTHAVLCPAGEEGQFERDFLTVVGLSSWPSLNNTGDELSIRDGNDNLIHQINYLDDWYEVDGDDSKKSGGWSLEMIDKSNPCGGAENWLPSISPTGNSFGTANSVLGSSPDTTELIASQCFWMADTLVYLELNEAIFDFEAVKSSFKITSGSLELVIDSILPYLDSDDAFLIYTSNSELSREYQLENPMLFDCVGNPFRSSEILWASEAEEGELRINEILFDPYYSDGSDYLELVNLSEKNIRLDLLYLGDYNEEKNLIEEILPLSESPAVIESSENLESYLLISEEPQEVIDLYHQDLIESSSLPEINYIQSELPSYNNSDGFIILLNESGDSIDLFQYSDDLHHPLLEALNGVSLEKYGPALNSSEARNWSSATIGPKYGEPVKGSPGLENSIKAESDASSSIFYVDPKLFVPSVNGQLNSVSFHYDLPPLSSYAASLTIYSDDGFELIKLLNNEPVPTSGFVSWNGTLESGALARVGIYIAVFEAFEPGGTTRTEKQVFTIAPSN